MEGNVIQAKRMDAQLSCSKPTKKRHWQHIRTTNPIESAFATVRLRTTKSKSCGSRKTTLAMTYKLMTTAESKWRRLRGYRLLADVVQGVKFKDGIRVEQDQSQDAA